MTPSSISPHDHESGPLGSLARKHGVSTEAIQVLLIALRTGGGNSAQFSHPELGGMGQWSRSGMTMVGDMFNQDMKRKVDDLCQALTANPGLLQTPDQDAREAIEGKLVWWPRHYGSPSAMGGQNHFRYAYFPHHRTLVVDDAGKQTAYDTTGNKFHGFAQQQPSTTTLSIHTDRGPVALSSLPHIRLSPPSH